MDSQAFLPTYLEDISDLFVCGDLTRYRLKTIMSTRKAEFIKRYVQISRSVCTLI